MRRPTDPETFEGQVRTGAARAHNLSVWTAGWCLALVLCGCSNTTTTPDSSDKAELSVRVEATLTLSAAPHGVAIPANHDRVFIANFGDGALTVLDPSSLLFTESIPVGAGAVNVLVSERRGHVYVTNELGGTLSVLDLRTLVELKRIPLGSRPHGLDLDRSESTLLVCNLGSDEVSRIDLASLTEVGRIPVGPSPDSPLFTPDGRWVYVTNHNGRESSSLSKIATSTWTEVKRIPVGVHPHGIQISPDGTRLYVSLEGDDEVVVLETVGDSVVARYPAGALPHGLGLSPDGRYLWAGNLQDHDITILEAASGEKIATLALGVGAQPHVIVFSPAGDRAYVSDFFRREVVIVAISTSFADSGNPAAETGAFTGRR